MLQQGSEASAQFICHLKECGCRGRFKDVFFDFKECPKSLSTCGAALSPLGSGEK